MSLKGEKKEEEPFNVFDEEDEVEDDVTSSESEINENKIHFEKKDRRKISRSNDKHDLAYQKRKRYIRICESLKIPIISIYIERLTTPNLLLAHRGIGSRAMHGIALSLRHNTWVTNIDLTDNNLDKNAANSLAVMFEDNHFIVRLNLTNNHIGQEGTERLLGALSYHTSIAYLSLSENRLPDKIAKPLGEFLSVNNTLLELDLSKNELSTESGSTFKESLPMNRTLLDLDLSWNQFRGQGAVDVAAGLAQNKSLVNVNLAWNGFSNIGSQAIGKCISMNKTLTQLDLSHNRVGCKGLKEIGEALRTNTTLDVLRLGWNQLKSNSVNKVLIGCLENPKHTIQSFHFESTLMNNENITNINKLIAKNPTLQFTHGGYSKEKAFDDNPEDVRMQLLNILRTYLVDNRLRMVDLFNRWDKDKSYSLTHEEFRKGVADCGIPFTESQLNLLIKWLDSDNSDSIEYNEFVGITEIE
ncbi:leucine-rich repeat-containing protein 74B-like [Clytia hemisphaerica]|uniref:leucine-rich repeat-containing protein 74B-like n=1 Tax=Clytia hemisphaerica TaxID=252671 RepID=UPI0034D76BBC